MNGIQYYVKSNYFFMQRHKYLDLNTTLSLPQQEQYKLRNQFFFEFFAIQIIIHYIQI